MARELKAQEKDVILELSSICMGSAATALSGYINAQIKAVPPQIALYEAGQLQQAYEEKGVVARIAFKEGLQGQQWVLLSEADGSKLAAMMFGSDPVDAAGEIGEMELSALNEAIGTAMSSYATALAGFTGGSVELETPSLEINSLQGQDLASFGLDSADFAVLTFGMEIEPDHQLTWIQVLPLALLQEMIKPLMPEDAAAEEAPLEEPSQEAPPQEELPQEGPPEEEAVPEDVSSDVPLETEEADPAFSEQEGPAAEPAAEPAEERDMLLEGMDDEEPEQDSMEEASREALPALGDLFSSMEQDTIAEIGNISLGSSATTLSELVNKSVKITTPRLSITTLSDIQKSYPQPSLVSRVQYRQGLEGENILILKEKDAALIAALMMGLPPEEFPEALDEISMSAISEAMNQMMGSASTSMSDFLSRTIDISPPELECCNLQEDSIDTATVEGSDPVLKVEFSLEIADLLQSNLVQVMPISFAKDVTTYLLKDYMEQEAAEKAETPAETAADGVPEQPAPKPGSEELDEMQKDVLAEVGNISLGSSATALAQLINRQVQITTPRITLTNMKEVRNRFPVPCLVVKVNYIKGLEGENVLIIKEDDALIITGLMMGLEPPEKPEKLEELELSAISEAMNQMMGSASTAMSDFFERVIDISPPDLSHKDLHTEDLDADEIAEETPLVQISFQMEVEGLIDSELIQLVPLEFAREIASYLLSALSGEELDHFEEEAEEAEEPEDIFSSVLEGAGPAEDAQAQAESPAPAKEPAQEKSAPREVPVQEKLDEEEAERLDMIRDIPVEISAVLGRTRVPLKSVTSLFAGDIINLERYVGEPVELLANDRLVAKGEVVLVNGQFGIKITSMVKS